MELSLRHAMDIYQATKALGVMTAVQEAFPDAMPLFLSTKKEIEAFASQLVKIVFEHRLRMSDGKSQSASQVY